MRRLLLKLIISTSFCIAVSLIMHSKGPTHRKIVDACLGQIIKKNFHFRYGKSDVNHTMLLTMMVMANMTSPAFEIQENILRRIHDMAKSYMVEVLSFGRRFEFESYAECLEDECQKSFIIDFKSNFYVIVVDSINKFDVALEVLEDSNTFNPNAIYLVYIEYTESKYLNVARRILLKMWDRLLTKTAVLIPKTLQVLNFYRLNRATRGPYECESNITLVQVDQCVKGKMLNPKNRHFEVEENRNLLNCSVGVITTPYKPFVINKTHGFEIEVLRSIANIINVHFNITVIENLTDTWGSEVNDTWTGKLKYVYEDFYLGVGNVETGMSYATDFSFSRFYHMEPLVFVVPMAKFVPKWRVLVAIFTLEMWGICLAIIVCFAISFYFASKYSREVENFKGFTKCFYQSFQIIVYHAVPAQPISDLTRVFFASLALISIILASAYTCSLVYYLKNPIREHQAKKISDIMDTFGEYKFGIGGVSRLRELFTFSSQEEGTKLYQMYQTAVGDNDTLLYWIRKVADERNIWTISSRLYVDYLLAKGSTSILDEDGKPTIYVFRKKLMSYSISIIVRKGHPLLPNIDYAIEKLTWGGLVAHMTDKYTKAARKKSYAVHMEDDDSYAPLDIDNLQGAFALLAMGCCLGFVSLLMECVVAKYINRKSKKNLMERVNKIKRVDKTVKNNKLTHK